MATKKFSGELAEPLKPMFRGGLFSTGQSEEADARERAEILLRKLQALAAHYGVENQDLNLQTLYVALALAKEFVPGFKVADPNKRDGRPEVWTDIREGFLIVEIDKEMERGSKCGVSIAALKLSKRTPWKEICKLAGSKDARETLRKRYYSARKTNRWQAILRDSQAYEKLVNQTDDGVYAQMLHSLHKDIPKTMYD